MTASAIGFAFFVVWFLFSVPTAIFLLRAYGRSKMSGFLWLLVALVVWPFLAQGARLGLPALVALMGYGITPMLIMNFGLSLITALLVLIAVVILDGELARRIVAAQPAVSPAPSVIAAPPPPTDLR